VILLCPRPVKNPLTAEDAENAEVIDWLCVLPRLVALRVITYYSTK